MKNKRFILTKIFVVSLMILSSFSETKELSSSVYNDDTEERLFLLEQENEVHDYLYYVSHAYILSQNEQYREAISDLQKAVKEKETGSAYSILTSLNFFVKDYENTVNYAEKALELCTDEKHQIVLQELLGETYFENGEYELALEAFDNAIKLGDTKFLTRLYHLISKSIITRNSDILLSFFNEIQKMKDDKNYDEYIRLYGEALLSMGHKKAAYEVFSAAYKDEPDVLIWKLFIDYFHMLWQEKCSLDQFFIAFPIGDCYKRIPSVFSRDECISILRFCIMYFYVNRAVESEKTCCAVYKYLSEYRDEIEPFNDEQEVFSYMKNDILFIRLREVYGF